jgi:hypothetical protein
MHKSRKGRGIVPQAAILTALLGGSAVANGGEPARARSWSQAISQVDAACLLQWISSSPANEFGIHEGCFQVVEVLKCPPQAARKGDRVSLQWSREAGEKSLYFTLGMRNPKGPGIVWEEPFECTCVGFDYVAHAPAFGGKLQKRLPYFLQFLDSPDPFIIPDARAELAQASLEDLVALVPYMPRDKFRKMMVDPTIRMDRLSFPSLMLGLCGDAEDAKLFAAKITEKPRNFPDDFRPGVELLITGYLMLAGESGLDHLDAWRFRDSSAPFSETIAAMRALEITWHKGNGKIKKDRLVQSMRLLLAHPELADLVIPDLAHWRDWGSLDRIAGLYGQGHFNIPSIKRAVIRYLQSCVDAKPTDVQPAQAAAAKRHLERIRRDDPKIFAEAERFISRQNNQEPPQVSPTVPAR